MFEVGTTLIPISHESKEYYLLKITNSMDYNPDNDSRVYGW